MVSARFGFGVVVSESLDYNLRYFPTGCQERILDIIINNNNFQSLYRYLTQTLFVTHSLCMTIRTSSYSNKKCSKIR